MKKIIATLLLGIGVATTAYPQSFEKTVDRLNAKDPATLSYICARCSALFGIVGSQYPDPSIASQYNEYSIKFAKISNNIDKDLQPQYSYTQISQRNEKVNYDLAKMYVNDMVKLQRQTGNYLIGDIKKDLDFCIFLIKK